jgi:hypothetical protein
MYELGYVKKRKRKVLAAVASLIGGTGVGALVIVAFLGRFVGTFTVTVDNGDVKLALSEHSAFEEAASMLRVNELRPYTETTITALPSDGQLDNEETPYTLGAIYDDEGNWEKVEYFKYTYFVKNVGNKSARYEMTVNIVDEVPADDGRTLYDTVRIMVYSNDGADPNAHERRIFAAPKLEEYNYNANGDRTKQEFVSEPPANKTEDPEHPLAETFEDRVIARYTVDGFGIGDMMRYTIVTWLEGNDPEAETVDSQGKKKDPPYGASLKLGVEIKAYES